MFHVNYWLMPSSKFKYEKNLWKIPWYREGQSLECCHCHWKKVGFFRSAGIRTQEVTEGTVPLPQWWEAPTGLIGQGGEYVVKSVFLRM